MSETVNMSTTEDFKLLSYLAAGLRRAQVMRHGAADFPGGYAGCARSGCFLSRILMSNFGQWRDDRLRCRGFGWADFGFGSRSDAKAVVLLDVAPGFVAVGTLAKTVNKKSTYHAP